MRSLGLIVLLLLVACSESFLPAWAVTDLRVIGARVEVNGQPERARPEPGDQVQVSMIVIDQGAPPSEDPDVPALTPELLRWAFIPCIPQATLFGSPICRTPIQPCDGCEGAPSDDRLAFPVLSFRVPDQVDLDAAEADSVVVQGAVCIHGVPSLEAIQRFLLGETDDLQPCTSDGEPDPREPPPEGRLVTVRVPIEPIPEDPNLNPEIINVTLDGSSWPPPYNDGVPTVPRTAPGRGCEADLEGLTDAERAEHPVAGSQPADIRLFVTRESLQPYVFDDMTRKEELQVSWLTDAGDLETTFSFITDPAVSILTQWLPPPSIPLDANGVLVRFNFVIRDGRGGTDWVERGLCVLPDTPSESPP